jgi:hypothetical protein
VPTVITYAKLVIARLLALHADVQLPPILYGRRTTVNTKLTLRLDDGLIRNAKRYSGKSGKSVSRLVADYFALIDSGEEVAGPEITPRVRSLIGSLKGATATEEDYRRHVEEKYR